MKDYLQQGGWVYLTTGLLSAFLTYGLIYWSKKRQIYDLDPHGIKSQNNVATFGGVALFISFWAGVYLLKIPFSPFTKTLAMSSLIVLVTGIIDDYHPLSPVQKSIGILIASHLLYAQTDIQIAPYYLLSTLSPGVKQSLIYLATIGWFYFLTNSVNLLDGLDGVASSVSATSLIMLALISLNFSLTVQKSLIQMMLLLVCAIIGFLFFNWPPAKIYLGDTGSLFIGFMCAVFSVSGLKNASFYTLLVPLLVYLIPVFDAFYALVRRLFSGHSISKGDQEHLHHRMLHSGWHVQQIIFGLVSLTIVSGLLASLTYTYYQYRHSILLVVVLLILSLIGWMKYLKKDNK
ncbi:undecaprenyl/decaprenyl-phosphate alpha-N-acetylglucosaminyl 1-phosphate transferase [Dolosicoccus paucivorans]|uniref:Undecaprenyl/decaprenyl-phosphate alpha-N-acetylglucosaminyl 1-phosphate transferase n=1 Tax=Dolosicoccus paucivorans TaxID=84521 RepID=A0A2N6SNA0_9LACT|nr:MraY family glycosyltransferase [Dolosicoccus paucivorans]PMB84800.1 undecaprenyl/decaprenyl-phosphate alpha-N-acetylglucosaminyl 1-phosphate transferase [Dolosicoccus paucivorans]PMC58558.1 undecaprenyl/decaprenyl-phosphate alpha-N-acetylglucosaminyl 1-phosphate transferase [Dolosicoccus paucivorans]